MNQNPYTKYMEYIHFDKSMVIAGACVSPLLPMLLNPHVSSDTEMVG